MCSRTFGWLWYASKEDATWSLLRCFCMRGAGADGGFPGMQGRQSLVGPVQLSCIHQKIALRIGHSFSLSSNCPQPGKLSNFPMSTGHVSTGREVQELTRSPARPMSRGARGLRGAGASRRDSSHGSSPCSIFSLAPNSSLFSFLARFFLFLARAWFELRGPGAIDRRGLIFRSSQVGVGCQGFRHVGRALHC